MENYRITIKTYLHNNTKEIAQEFIQYLIEQYIVADILIGLSDVIINIGIGSMGARQLLKIQDMCEKHKSLVTNEPIEEKE